MTIPKGYILHSGNAIYKIGKIPRQSGCVIQGIILFTHCSLFVVFSIIMFYSYNGHVPQVHPTAYIHPQAVVTGQVTIGPYCYIGPGAALRADWGAIVLHYGCNVQENCTIHMFPGITVILEQNAHIGHGAVIHGAHIGANCLVGMNAVIMDRVVLGAESIVGALTFIKEGHQIPPRSLVVGNPGRIVKEVTPEMISWKTQGTRLYQALPAQLQQEAPCQPVMLQTTTVPPPVPPQEYLNWSHQRHEH